jgi:hypothetical protein
MPPDTKDPVALPPSVVDQLACPVCFASLRIESIRLVCAGCGRAYPIIDGIPVLIAAPEKLDAI